MRILTAKMHVGTIVTLITLAGFTLLAVALVLQGERGRLWHQLMENPQSLPDYLLCVGPSPGSIYPSSSRDCEYWGGPPTLHDGKVCVAIDARVIVPGISDPDVAFEVVPIDNVDLLLNGKAVNTLENAQELPDGSKQLPREQIPHYAMGVAIPEGGPVPVHFCWNIVLSPGQYLAEVIVQSQEARPLRYQWAFSIDG